MIKTISSDPFERTDTVRLMRRRKAEFGGPPCTFCDGPGKFSYGVFSQAKSWGVEDALWREKPFCSISCWRAYNG